MFRRFVSTRASILKRPIFDYKSIVENESVLATSIKRRELSPSVMENCSLISSLYEEFVKKDKIIRDSKHQRRLIEAGFKETKEKSKLEDLKKIKSLVKDLELELIEVKALLNNKAESLPNLIHDSVQDLEVVVHEIHPKSIKEVEDPVYDHKEIAEKLGIIDFKKLSQVSGTSWYYLMGDGALLEQALVQYALKLARQSGFKMCIPPSIVRSEITDGCGFKPRDQNNEQQVYELTNEGLCLTGTAEIPIAGLYINHVFEDLKNPEKLVGVSRSYRAEAGARGKDTKGLYRVHEFTKVELFVFSENDTDTSSKILEEQLLEFQKKFITSLGLTAKVLNMPANDLGSPAFQKFDIEAFMPGRGKWGELTSSSNCLDYQARRLNIKYRTKEGDLKYVHTLNGTAVAVPRCIVAIIENFYDPETESIKIPEVLRVYMDGKDKIVKQ